MTASMLDLDLEKQVNLLNCVDVRERLMNSSPNQSALLVLKTINIWQRSIHYLVINVSGSQWD